jgi:hypothetical protein
MSRWRPGALSVWAAREVLRRPWEGALTGLALAALVATVATSLLLVEAAGRTAERLIDAAPAVVVRRLDLGGWASMPVDEAIAAASEVRGLQRPRARVWGVIGGPDGPITLVGCDEAMRADLAELGLEAPAAGEAIVGHRHASLVGETLTLANGERWDTLDVTASFGRRADVAVHDVVLVDLEVARWLLGLPDGHATDLVGDVFHEEEAEALHHVIGRTFPFPVRVVVRSGVGGVHGDVLARRGTLGALTAVPAGLALLLLVIGAARDGVGRSEEVGLLKTMGWTTSDVVRLHLLRALAVGLPAVAVGLALAWGFVFWPGADWPGRLLLGWQGDAPDLWLDAAGAGLVMLEVAGLVLVPWLVATTWPVVRGAAADPRLLLEER